MAFKGPPPAADLEGTIGHAFADPTLLTRALTHLSAVTQDQARAESYQRLEFLGDRVLGLVVADMLHATFPQASEGELSRRLAELVRRETCAEVAAEWRLGPHVRVSVGEAQSGGRKKAAILSDVCEAVIGGVFLDGGYEAARGVVDRAWRARMMTPRRPLLDPKTALQEWAQARGHAPPTYTIRQRSGPDHAPHFDIEVLVADLSPVSANGPSRRLGEQRAAEAFMAREGISARERTA